jgi:hypothetical protein
VSRKVGGTAVESYRGLQRQMEGTSKAWDDLKRTVGEEIFSAKVARGERLRAGAQSHGRHLQEPSPGMKDVWNSIPDGVRDLGRGVRHDHQGDRQQRR